MDQVWLVCTLMLITAALCLNANSPFYYLFFVGFARKKFPALISDSGVKISLRNKITCIEATLRKKTVQV